MFLAAVSLTLHSCAKAPETSGFEASKSLPGYTQPTFSQYAAQTKEWIQNNRVFLTKNRAKELQTNTPFEQRPQGITNPKKGILLVHGLGDSPGYFKDIAGVLAKQGFLVRTILLPGHGSKPADASLARYEDWSGAVAHHAALLEQKVDTLWLGGFSTGANLVTSYALDHDNVEGLLLFSPAFYPKAQTLLRFAPVISYLWDWVDVDQEKNIMRYDSLSTHLAKLYYYSMKEVQQKLEDATFQKPVLMTFSADDSVLKPQKTKEVFTKRFLHPGSVFVCYGSCVQNSDPRIQSFPGRIPASNISNFSHLSVLFSPQHWYYGKNGEFIMYNNGQEDKNPPTLRSNLWFSAWGYKQEGKYHARLTYNPYFKQLRTILAEVLR